MVSHIKYLLAAAALLLGGAVHAERPMVVDDAGTLPLHARKIEFGFNRDGNGKAVEAAAGFGLFNGLEAGVGIARSREGAARATSMMLAFKWVPLQAEQGLSAGLRLDLARELGNSGERATSQALVALASWRFSNGMLWHNNLGHFRRASHSVIGWGSGIDWPLNEDLHVAGEFYGERGAQAGRQLGLRWEVANGVKLSGGIGRANGGRVANAGLAWEF